MNFKRISSAVLAAALTASSIGVYSYAAEDQAMKTALTYVKQRIDIPEKLTEFSYTTQTDTNNTRYTFKWSNKLEDGSSNSRMTVSITGKVIKSVYISNNEEPVIYNEYDDTAVVPANIKDALGTSFAKLSDKKLLEAAKKYIKQINPTINDNIEVEDDSLNISLWGKNATLRFHRVANGVPVTNQSGSITINKDTGELISYSFNWINGASFSDKKDAISQSKAQEAFRQLFPVELYYKLSYDWENDKYVPHLIYHQTKNGQINAFTGKLSTFEDYGYYGSDDDYDDDADVCADEAAVATNSAMGATKEVTFTQAEIEKLENESKLIKAEEAIEKLRKLDIFFIPEASQVEYQNCSFDDRLGIYIRNVSFSARAQKYVDLNGDGTVQPVKITSEDEYDVWGNFSINAETGDILNFYCYAPDNGTNMDSKTYDKKAENVLKKLLNEKIVKSFGKLECTYNDKYYSEYDPKTGRPIGEPRIISKSYSANREAYGIKCADESVSLQFANNGYVTSYSLNYHADVTYPKPDKILSESKAYASFFEQVDLGLKYRCAYRTDTKKVLTALVYSADKTLNIDAFTGKLTNYDGSEIYVDETTGDYTDLKNNKYAKYAEKLKKYGIVLMDEKGRLNAKKSITAKDFADLLNQVGLGGGIGNLKETTKLKRQTAAYVIVGGVYGSPIAEMTSIFKNKFSDVKDDNKYLGYIMIADASGLFTGNGTKFEPEKSFTRGEAIKYVYDLLS